MSPFTRFAIVFLLCLFCVACSMKPHPPTTAKKFIGLIGPSSVYQVGTVLRTINSESLSSRTLSPDELTVAYLPKESPALQGDYANMSETVLSGADASLIGQAFEKWGVTAEFEASTKYNLIAEAKDNRHYIATDTQLFSTLKGMYEKESVLFPDADYYFVKEAIGSKQLKYSASANVEIKASAKLDADSSKFSVDIKPINATSSIDTQKELIAFVVVEKLSDLSTISGANGIERFSFTKTKISLNEELKIIGNTKSVKPKIIDLSKL